MCPGEYRGLGIKQSIAVAGGFLQASGHGRLLQRVKSHKTGILLEPGTSVGGGFCGSLLNTHEDPPHPSNGSSQWIGRYACGAKNPGSAAPLAAALLQTLRQNTIPSNYPIVIPRVIIHILTDIVSVDNGPSDAKSSCGWMGPNPCDRIRNGVSHHCLTFHVGGHMISLIILGVVGCRIRDCYFSPSHDRKILVSLTRVAFQDPPPL